MTMIRKIVDVLKEVFWIKPSRKRHKPARRTLPVGRKKARKAVVKKKPKPPSKAKVLTAIDPSLVQVGVITHYFDRIKVSVVKLTQGTVLIGDKLTIVGNKTKFIQKVWSMQIESEDVKVAKKGQLIGLKVDKIVAVGDKVYK
jgi:translation initiation factor IF-2